jgi:pimeloyl-ACP methyl ester carboxylesterase
VAVDEGVELDVRHWPGGEGVPILLLHGLASNRRTWDAAGDRLHGHGHPVAAVDQRGHGRSDKPETGYDFATLCRDQLRVMEALGWERPVVAGQSFGGNLAVDLAYRHPQKVAAVAGVDGGLIEPSRLWPRWEDCAEALAPPDLTGTPAATIEQYLRRAHPDWSDDGVEATMANFEVLADGTVRARLARNHHMHLLRAMWEQRPGDLVREVEVPVLLVLADSGDHLSEDRRRQADLAAALPLVRVEWFAPADHDVHVQRPDEVADLLHDLAAAGSA